MITDLPVFDVLPDLAASALNPLVLAAASKFEADSHLDQFGPAKPEPSNCFVAGQSVVLRNAWGELLGRVPLSEINPPTN